MGMGVRSGQNGGIELEIGASGRRDEALVILDINLDGASKSQNDQIGTTHLSAPNAPPNTRSTCSLPPFAPMFGVPQFNNSHGTHPTHSVHRTGPSSTTFSHP